MSSNNDRGMYSRNGIWYSRIADANGRIVRKKLSADKATARAILAQMRGTFERQKHGVLPENMRKQVRKLSELYDEYLRHLKAGSHSDNSVSAFMNAWRQVVYKNGFVYLSDIDIIKVEEWARRKQGEGTRGQTLNTYIIHVNGVFEWSFRNGFIHYNPLANWRPVRVNEPRKRRDLKPEEINAFLAAEWSDEWKLRWLIYLFTGLRNEAGSVVRWDWIDWEARVLNLPTEANKSRRKHSIPLHPTLYAALKDWRLRFAPEKSGDVFRRLTTRSIARRFKEVCFKAGVNIDGITLHSVRHTFATMIYENSGNNLKAVQELLGHASVSTTMRYLHLSEVERVQAVNSLDFDKAAEQ